MFCVEAVCVFKMDVDEGEGGLYSGHNEREETDRRQGRGKTIETEI